MLTFTYLIFFPCVFKIQNVYLWIDVYLSFKANVGSVMEQLDTLFLLKDKFESDVIERGIDPTIKMEKSIKGNFIFNILLFFLEFTLNINRIMGITNFSVCKNLV